MNDRFRPFLLALAVASLAAPDSRAAEPSVTLYVGTYTDGTSKGIYRTALDLATGTATAPVLAGEAKNPSFLALHPSGRFLYAVSEVDEIGPEKGGGVLAFAVDAKTGDLTLLNQQPSKGGAPCHLVVDKTGKNVLVANYGGGSVCSFPIGDDGSLKEGGSVIQHKGSSVNEKRQKEPHAHSINVDKEGKYAFAADLGLDQVLVYKLNAAHGTIEPNDPPHAKVAPGSGPRHFAAAFDRPVVTLFGPTHIAWTDTYYAKAVHLQKEVDCGPCQQRVCPLDHRCMTRLTPDEVVAAARQLLAQHPSATRETRHAG